MFHISRYTQLNQHKIIGSTLLEFKAGIEYFTLNTTVATDGSSQSSNEALVAKK